VTLGNRIAAVRVAATAAALAMLVGCGGGSSPTSATKAGGVSGSPGPVGATITIQSNGAVSPSQVTIATGQSVAFVNNDSRVHDMTSDPHPLHTDCPELNAAGLISAGQAKNTNAFPVARTCGFHDHNNPETAALTGRIVIQ
jgi:plastocyanin